ncbi:hypothetical protein F2P81_001119 [Scophthalmus maximus]|uniref:Reverse transcriptase domain-containing protein n=1 Tax=Scophthalmus maximus TaxID=52904 RepID=A0A6A4TIY3_SCOMX|nr:hypothetical protein F2P81_001119 [Scophthalmus maximus]
MDNSRLGSMASIHSGAHFDLEAIEPHSIALKSSPRFTGIHGAELEHKVSLHADELLLFVTDPGSGVDDILQILKTFRSFWGYKLNISKIIRENNLKVNFGWQEHKSS